VIAERFRRQLLACNTKQWNSPGPIRAPRHRQLAGSEGRDCLQDPDAGQRCTPRELWNRSLIPVARSPRWALRRSRTCHSARCSPDPSTHRPPRPITACLSAWQLATNRLKISSSPSVHPVEGR
jgi:hypothetical protein